MKVIKGSLEDIKKVGVEVREGKIVAFPTDTVYGLGAEVSNDDAIKRVYNIKDRPLDSPLIVLIGHKDFLKELVYLEDSRVDLLIDRFWPGALTLLLPKKEWVSDIITAGGKSLGVRMPDNEIARELIIASGGALATPSANKSGQLSPTSAEHVIKQFSYGEIDYVIDGGKTEKAIESTILDMTKDTPIILRNGAVTKEEIEEVIGKVEEIKVKKKAERNFSKEIQILKREELYKLDSNELILAFTPIKEKNFEKIEVLSENGDYKEAARNLFEMLHKLLDLEGERIYVEELEEEGLAKVIMERIKKIAR